MEIEEEEEDFTYTVTWVETRMATVHAPSPEKAREWVEEGYTNGDLVDWEVVNVEE